MVFSPRLAAAIFVASQAAHALGYTEYPVGIVNTEAYGTLNFTEIFTPFGADMSNAAWAREAYNGLTSFARAPPIRCFGADADTGYDVAVIGAPFDTATSFRPG